MNIFSKLKLHQKGLILISVPLIFEITLVASLANLLYQSDHELWKETHARLIINSSNEILRLFIDAGGSLYLYHTTSNELFLHRYGLTVSDLNDQLKRIKMLLGGNPSETASLNRFQTVVGRGLNLLEGARRSADREGQGGVSEFLRSKAEESEFQNLMSDLIKEVEGLAQLQRASRQVDPKVAAFLRSAIIAVLISGFAVSLVLAVWLAGFFSRNISSRLLVLQENSHRLSRQEKLTDRLEGSDEIAELDKVFHDMAAALAEAQRKERAVVENAAEVIFSLAGDGTFVSVNQAAATIWGFEPAALRGEPLARLVSEDDMERVSEALARIKSGEGVASLELKVNKADGTTAFNQWSTHFVESENQLFCVAHDITERKQLERMKQDFFAMVSHDLRSPLTAVEGCLELIAVGARGEVPPGIVKEINFGLRNIQRLVRLVNDLLDLEKIEAGKMSMDFDCWDLAPIIERSLEAIAPLAEDKELSLVFGGSELEVFCDRERLVQVVINLLSNAIKYSPARGKITVSASACNNFARVEISDEGRGIPEEFRKKIFSRYEQVGKQHTVGTGLGLAICKLIVDEHKGEIDVESETGKGSTFWFTVPLALDQ
jgi:PAS domain S-box-containing protein